MATKLTEKQKSTVADWVAEGATLSQVQRRLQEELGMSMTYMDARFLIIDLGLEIKEAESSRKPEEAGPVGQPDVAEIPDPAAETSIPEPAVAPALSPDDGAKPAGSVSVEVDRITRPGSVMSGTVVFSDGVKAVWLLDQLGRLGLQTDQAEYSPSQEDVQEFQKELEARLSGGAM